jgi:hypothetical protein
MSETVPEADALLRSIQVIGCPSAEYPGDELPA